ncbi:phage tail tube protein [Halomonas elongata]|uniref:phage tail tube protein n=1 Tax=Halomonas elongata TaxID=2746 RepID=UPI00255AF3E3|nr:phage tail tube protein [Halomonas elongata]MDL4862971.1 phage tail tube protein [Halomonas elongata]
MAKKWRKRFAVAQVESAYGEASADMTGATILEVVMLDGGNPYAGNTVDRERQREGLGAFEQINTGPYVERTIRVPLSGSGTAGEVPSFGILLRACGLSETINVDTDVVYQPASEGHESLELWWMEDGQMQHINGARGTASITTDSQGLPYIEFQFTGLYKKTEAAGDASVATQAVQAKELPVNKQNTVASIDGHNACMSSLSLDFGNTVEYRNLVNCESVQISDRQVTGSTNIEAPDLATADYFAKVESHNGVTLVPVVFTHGKTDGNIVEIQSNQGQLASISPTDNQGIMHYDLNLRFPPSSAGDDDFTLTFK